MPLPIRRLFSINNNTSSCSASMLIGSNCRNERITDLSFRFPQASSPTINGWHNTSPLLSRVANSAFPSLKCETQIDVSTRTMIHQAPFLLDIPCNLFGSRPSLQIPAHFSLAISASRPSLTRAVFSLIPVILAALSASCSRSITAFPRALSSSSSGLSTSGGILA